MSTSALPNTDANSNDALQQGTELSTSSSDQQALKRPNTDDLDFQPIKKQNSSFGEMAGLGVGGAVGGATVDQIEVPENAVGLVIGRGGESITSIQQQSGCRVQLAADGSGGGVTRACTLQGTPEAIERAKQLITETITRARSNNSLSNLPNGGGGGGGGSGGGGGNGNAQFVTQQLLIPGTKCGLIIGKSGETIKNMQESIGVRMLLIQETQQPGNTPKPLRITGTIEKVEQAKRAVELLLANDESNSRSGGGGLGGAAGASLMNQTRSMGEVIVPRNSVGVIIGKGGETIKRLAAESGTKIQFKPDLNPQTPERCAVIQGTPQQIERATNLIWDLVQRSNGTSQQEVCLMHVPANKTGLVIGKGGDTIKAICNESGAHVELSREPQPNAQEKVFIIKGTPYQIHSAQHMIRIKVGDIQPGTPAPPFPGVHMGGGYQAQQFALSGGSTGGDQYGGQQQWPANGYGATQNAQWPANQYYGQQQQGYAPGGQAHYGGGQPQFTPNASNPQQPMIQQGAMAPQQQPQPSQQSAPSSQGSQPAINPSTGQPDYSAQWAEYYRSVGLHDQAALIEQQMKSTAKA